MDSRITKKRLANTLAYDWVKIVLIIGAIALLWSLAYTTGAPRASTGQTFGLLVYSVDFSAAQDPDALAEAAKAGGAFSYDVLNFSCRTLGSEAANEVLMTTASVQECDVIILSDFQKDQEENKSKFRGVVDGYWAALYGYDQLIEDAQKYCLHNGFVYEENGSYMLNNEIIAAHFASRMKKDPRFRDKNGERYAQGVQGEIKRIKDVWNNAVILKQVLEAHPELRVNYVPYAQSIAASPEEFKGEEYQNMPELTYGINLGKLTGGDTDITKLYATSILDEDGKLVDVSADGIIASVYNFNSHQPDLQYEAIGFINYLIKTYSNFVDGPFESVIA